MGWLLIFLSIKAQVLILHSPLRMDNPLLLNFLSCLVSLFPQSAMQPPGHSLIPSHAQLGTLLSIYLFPQEPCDPLPHFLEVWSQVSPPRSPAYLKSRPPCFQTRYSSFLLYFSLNDLAPTAINLPVYFLPLPIRMPSSWEQSCYFVPCSISSSQTHTGTEQMLPEELLVEWVNS